MESTVEESSVPRQFQDWLQQLYRLPAMAPVDAFLLHAGSSGGPTETLLLREMPDALEFGVYLDPRVVGRLEARGGLANFAQQSLEDFWTVLEGVSHFVCLAWHAERDREISPLDLEVQAEIDKYVTAWELGRQSGLGDLAGPLHRHLFRAWRPVPGMNASLADRYRRASTLAGKYCFHLSRTHCTDSLAMRAELREFFRLPPHRRRERISALADLPRPAGQ